MKRLICIALFVASAHADNCSLLPAQTNLPWNGLLPRPTMGWASWYGYAGSISDSIIQANADALISTGLAALGYHYVNIDDGWSALTRTGGGDIQPDATKFPSGMYPVASYVHSAGVTTGTYSFIIGGSPGLGTLTSVVVLSNVGTVTLVTDYTKRIGTSVSFENSPGAVLDHAYTIANLAVTPSTTTFTITTSGVANGTYNTFPLLMHAPHGALKFGLYSSPGSDTCLGLMGSGGHEAADASTFSNWGADYLKYDWCTASTLYLSCYTTKTPEVYQLMAQSLRATGNSVALSGLGPLPAGQPDPWTYYQNAGYNDARIADDLFNSMLPFGYNTPNTMDIMATLSTYQQFGAYPDPDFLIGGNGITLDQAKTQFSMLALWSSQLIISTDMTAGTFISSGLRDAYANTEVIAIDQDPMVKMATRFSKTTCGSWSCQLWFKEMSYGHWAVGMVNLDAAPHSMTVNFSDVSAPGTFKARDVWAGSNLGTLSTYTTTVGAYSTVLLTLNNDVLTSTLLEDFTTLRFSDGTSSLTCPSATWKGTWSGGTTYAQCEWVIASGSIYVSRANGNVGNTPPSTGSNNVDAHWGTPIFNAYFGENPNQEIIEVTGASNTGYLKGTLNVVGSSGLYDQFLPSFANWAYPNENVLHWIKSGTWDADINRMSFEYTCDTTILDPTWSHSVEVGTYTRSSTLSNTGNAGQHYYHFLSPNTYAGKKIFATLNQRPEHRVSGVDPEPHPPDPEFTWYNPTVENLCGSGSDPCYNHYFDGMTRFYFDWVYLQSAPMSCKIGNFQLYSVLNETDNLVTGASGVPQGLIGSITATYSGPIGGYTNGRYEVVFNTPSQISGGQTYDIAYSTSDIHSIGFGSATSGGTVTGNSSSAYMGVGWYSSDTVQVPTMYVAIRPTGQALFNQVRIDAPSAGGTGGSVMSGKTKSSGKVTH